MTSQPMRDFDALVDTSRVKGEYTSGELAKHWHVNQKTVSRRLKKLAGQGLISIRRVTHNIIYYKVIDHPISAREA